MSRVQNRFALVFIPLSSFVNVLHGASMEDLSTNDDQVPDDSQAVVLYEESSDYWINVGYANFPDFFDRNHFFL